MSRKTKHLARNKHTMRIVVIGFERPENNPTRFQWMAKFSWPLLENTQLTAR